MKSSLVDIIRFGLVRKTTVGRERENQAPQPREH